MLPCFSLLALTLPCICQLYQINIILCERNDEEGGRGKGEGEGGGGRRDQTFYVIYNEPNTKVSRTFMELYSQKSSPLQSDVKGKKVFKKMNIFCQYYFQTRKPIYDLCLTLILSNYKADAKDYSIHVADAEDYPIHDADAEDYPIHVANTRTHQCGIYVLQLRFKQFSATAIQFGQ